ncbi:MAG: right-handed parallel beta-helix repeat-containing protein [Candidatus Thermoplasmatota archaeon]
MSFDLHSGDQNPGRKLSLDQVKVSGTDFGLDIWGVDEVIVTQASIQNSLHGMHVTAHRNLEVHDSIFSNHATEALAIDAGGEEDALIVNATFERNAVAFADSSEGARPRSMTIQDSTFRANGAALVLHDRRLSISSTLFEGNGNPDKVLPQFGDAAILLGFTGRTRGDPIDPEIVIRTSSFVGNHGGAVIQESADEMEFIDARENWWNSPQGPVRFGKAGVGVLPGEHVSPTVLVDPFLETPP